MVYARQRRLFYLFLGFLFTFLLLLASSFNRKARADEADCAADPSKCCWPNLSGAVCSTITNRCGPELPSCKAPGLIPGDVCGPYQDGAGCALHLCNYTRFSCSGCTSGPECSAFPDKPVCDGASGQCTECVNDSQCESRYGSDPGQKRFCESKGGTKQCVDCRGADSDCGAEQECIETQLICSALTCADPGQKCGSSSPNDLPCCSSIGDTVECKLQGTDYKCVSDSSQPCQCNTDPECPMNGEGWDCDKNVPGRTVCDDSSGKSGICVSEDTTPFQYKCVSGSCITCGASDTGCSPDHDAVCDPTVCVPPDRTEESTSDPSEPLPTGLDPQAIINLVVYAAAILAFTIAGFQVAIGGYQLMTSEGDPTKLAEGKERITSAVLAAIFTILGISILRYIVSTFT